MAAGRKTGGRSKGVPNRATAAKVKAVEASGLAPLDYLLSVMRDESVPREERVDAAHKAAPYVHPKLATVDHKSSDGTMSPKPDRIIIEAASADSDDPRLYVQVGGRSGFTPLSTSPRHLQNAIKYKTSDVKRLLRELAA